MVHEEGIILHHFDRRLVRAFAFKRQKIEFVFRQPDENTREL